MARSIIGSLRKIANLSRRDWLYVCVAAKELAIARVRHATEPTGRIVRALERPLPAERVGDPARAALDVARMAWAIGAVAARVPWRADCLLTAMAADRWLRRHKLQPEFYLGATKDASGKFGAHAWLQYQGTIVTGGTGEGYSRLIAPAIAPEHDTTKRAATAARAVNQ